MKASLIGESASSAKPNQILWCWLYYFIVHLLLFFLFYLVFCLMKRYIILLTCRCTRVWNWHHIGSDRLYFIICQRIGRTLADLWGYSCILVCAKAIRDWESSHTLHLYIRFWDVSTLAVNILDLRGKEEVKGKKI